MIIRVILIIIFIFNLQIAFSQVSGLNNLLENKDLFELELNQLDNDKLLKTDNIPVGNSVNPDFYFVGPGDILSIQIFPYQPNAKLLYVTPENSVLIPRIGEINLKGLTLNNVKDTISNLLKQINPNVKVYVTLRQARTCLVNIKGNVFNPNIFNLPSTYKVSTAINYANRFSAKESGMSVVYIESVLQIKEKMKDREKIFSGSGMPVESEYWRRNVKLLRNDGTSVLVDIEKATINNNPYLDPYIKEGDEIIVPFEQDNYPKIAITGAVVRPAILAYKKGDMASDLIKFGYGLTDNADKSNVFLINPNSGNKIKLEIDDFGNLLSNDFQIEPGAKIVVGSKSEIYNPEYGIISVQGQVKKPGNYLIKLNETKLKDAIELAGGFTEEAYLPLAKIYRRQEINSTLIDPRKEIFETMQYSDLKSDDTTRFFIDIQYKKPIVATDFEKLFKQNSDKDNVLLIDGDIINVPRNPGYIEVMGQVKNPGIVEFQEGKNMLWYIEKAGGFAEGSEYFRARIVRGRTNVWLEGDENTIVYAGDRIYVPRVPDEPTTVKLQRYTVYASIIATVSGLLNLIYLISR